MATDKYPEFTTDRVRSALLLLRVMVVMPSAHAYGSICVVFEESAEVAHGGRSG